MMELPALVPNGAGLMCAVESREAQREGSRQVVVRVSPCLNGRRVLSQSIHTVSAAVLCIPNCHTVFSKHVQAPNTHTCRDPVPL
jgi:hypothetical protein